MRDKLQVLGDALRRVQSVSDSDRALLKLHAEFCNEEMELRKKEIALLNKQVDLQRSGAALRWPGWPRDDFSVDDYHPWTSPVDVEPERRDERVLVYNLPPDESSELVYMEATELNPDSTLVVRQAGQLMAKKVLAAITACASDEGSARSACLTLGGNLGTGKSVWTNHMLLLCQQHGITVIQHDLKDKVVHLLQPGEPAQETQWRPDVIAEELRKQGVPRSKMLYLCDTGGSCSNNPQNLNCVTVLTTPPSIDHFKDFEQLYLVLGHMDFEGAAGSTRGPV